jgi:hypothetical protein
MIVHHPARERALLDDLMEEVFGFSFERWRAAGGWTADYTCYALVEQGAALASVGVYALDLLVNGQPQRARRFRGARAVQAARAAGDLSRAWMAYNCQNDTPETDDAAGNFYLPGRLPVGNGYRFAPGGRQQHQ